MIKDAWNTRDGSDTRNVIVDEGALEPWLPWEQILVLRVTGVTVMVAPGMS